MRSRYQSRQSHLYVFPGPSLISSIVFPSGFYGVPRRHRKAGDGSRVLFSYRLVNLYCYNFSIIGKPCVEVGFPRHVYRLLQNRDPKIVQYHGHRSNVYMFFYFPSSLTMVLIARRSRSMSSPFSLGVPFGKYDRRIYHYEIVDSVGRGVQFYPRGYGSSQPNNAFRSVLSLSRYYKVSLFVRSFRYPRHYRHVFLLVNAYRKCYVFFSFVGGNLTNCKYFRCLYTIPIYYFM